MLCSGNTHQYKLCLWKFPKGFGNTKSKISINIFTLKSKLLFSTNSIVSVLCLFIYFLFQLRYSPVPRLFSFWNKS